MYVQKHTHTHPHLCYIYIYLIYCILLCLPTPNSPCTFFDERALHPPRRFMHVIRPRCNLVFRVSRTLRNLHAKPPRKTKAVLLTQILDVDEEGLELKTAGRQRVVSIHREELALADNGHVCEEFMRISDAK